MAPAGREFRLYRYTGLLCRHDLLVRVDRPAYSNADQGAEDAADDFADSAAAHLREWWARRLLRRDCTGEHRSELLGTMDGDPPTDGALDGAGLRHCRVWVAHHADPRWIVVGEAASEAEFWTAVADDDRSVPERPAAAHDVYLLTVEDGRGDLTDA
ncbi:MAG TPA: hypothetical protein VH969_01315 [Actinophytocola sp.]|jgi:hypothetical protein|uniref:hypothetical protein n=1 Tax=Actinophytocola sp. TaxID=1872138 RepID=UPI002F932851